jgi:hypothetical protein
MKKRFGGTLPLFFIYFYINRAVIQYLYILLIAYARQRASSELGPAVQQAGALQTEPHRTLSVIVVVPALSRIEQYRKETYQLHIFQRHWDLCG